LFKKAAVFTDIHFGMKGNSRVHNQDCEDFVDWYIETAKQHGCETGIFCGDWNHNRNSLNLTTMDAGIRSLEKLGAAFEQFYMFAGNHDLYFKDKRDIKSTEWAKHIPGITVVDDIQQIEDVALVPWMVGDEWKKVAAMDCKYMFGHFELPNFLMNAMVRMPDHGELKAENLSKPEYVFSGHFHKRQSQKNVHYIGNAFPHNYADAWDDERGMMMLEWDGEPEFVSWPDAPSYKTLKLSQLLENPTQYLDSKTYARVTMDIDISYEEANFIKETFTKDHNVRELSLLPNKEKQDLDIIDEDIELNFDSIDSIVIDQLSNIESEHYNPQTLLEIYRNI
jgi:hypothetical protein